MNAIQRSVNVECTDTLGSYECSCSDGYNETDDGRSVDIDECLDVTVCHENASCMNTEGSYYCSCKLVSSETVFVVRTPTSVQMRHRAD